MESKSAIFAVSFADLFKRLLTLVNRKIQNGDFSERKFARLIGISQPQMHNVLKGARGLSPEIADRMLWGLNLSILDLMTSDERKMAAIPARSFDLPVERIPALMIGQAPAPLLAVRKAMKSAPLQVKKAAS